MKYVYLIKEKNGFYKIGISRNMRTRLFNLNGSHPESLVIVCAKLVKNAPDLEYSLHQKYAKLRTKTNTDWYALSPEDVINVCIEISNAEEDEYRFKVKDTEDFYELFSVSYKEISDEIIAIKKEIQFLRDDNDSLRKINKTLV